MIGGNVPFPRSQPKPPKPPKQNPYNYLLKQPGWIGGLRSAANQQADIARKYTGGFTFGIGGGGSATTPSYGGGGGYSGGSYDINSDPGVLAARAAYNQGVTNLDAWLRGQREGAFVDFGDPNLVIPGWNVDPNTAAMAKQNYASGNSILSRIDTSHTNAARSIINTLAAHGILNSGDLGYRQGVENQAYGNNVYDARKNLLGALNQDYQSYLDRKNSLQDAITQAIQGAYANQMAMASQYAGY